MFNRLREYVRAGMTIDIKTFGVFKGYNRNFRIFVYNLRKICEMTVYFAGNRVTFKPFAYSAGNARNRSSFGKFEYASVGKFDFHNISSVFTFIKIKTPLQKLQGRNLSFRGSTLIAA